MPTSHKQRATEIDLHHAIRNGRVEVVRRLLADGVDPNALDDKSRKFTYAFTALCTAIDSAAKKLSDLRVDLAELATQLVPGSPPADLQVERTRSLEILRLLLTAGAEPNRPMLSRTPLSLAVFEGDIEVVSTLLDAGASPTGESWSPFSKVPGPKGRLEFYRNAIHEAAEKGLTEVVQLLCERGADISARDHEGRTALQIARELGHSDIVEILEQSEQSIHPISHET